jgi:hypothetical protein
MNASERLKVAGQAAETLEDMGFVAVARLSDGVVTLECWERTGAGRMVRHIVGDELATRQILAESCAAALRGGTQLSS